MFGKSSHTFEINYIYQNDPRAETYDADVDSLSQGEAARHLIQLCLLYTSDAADE